ncbi:hypothetical protein ACFL2Y_00715 [Candidatus Omnitrophota bacterium]
MDYKLKVQRVEKSHYGALKEFSNRCDAGSGRVCIARLNDYFENNYDGFIAFFEDEIIGYSWWVDNSTKTRRKTPDLTLFGIELKDGDVYGFDFFIAPKFRGKHNSIEFMCKTNSIFRKLGYKRLFGYVDLNNTSARWIYKLIGFKDAKKIIQHRFFYFVLVINKTIFFKTSGWYLYYPYYYRAVFPFKKIRLLNR